MKSTINVKLRQILDRIQLNKNLYNQLIKVINNSELYNISELNTMYNETISKLNEVRNEFKSVYNQLDSDIETIYDISKNDSISQRLIDYIGSVDDLIISLDAHRATLASRLENEISAVKQYDYNNIVSRVQVSEDDKPQMPVGNRYVFPPLQVPQYTGGDIAAKYIDEYSLVFVRKNTDGTITEISDVLDFRPYTYIDTHSSPQIKMGNFGKIVDFEFVMILSGSSDSNLEDKINDYSCYFYPFVVLEGDYGDPGERKLINFAMYAVYNRTPDENGYNLKLGSMNISGSPDSTGVPYPMMPFRPDGVEEFLLQSIPDRAHGELTLSAYYRYIPEIYNDNSAISGYGRIYGYYETNTLHLLISGQVMNSDNVVTQIPDIGSYNDICGNLIIYDDGMKLCRVNNNGSVTHIDMTNKVISACTIPNGDTVILHANGLLESLTSFKMNAPFYNEFIPVDTLDLIADREYELRYDFESTALYAIDTVSNTVKDYIVIGNGSTTSTPGIGQNVVAHQLDLTDVVIGKGRSGDLPPSQNFVKWMSIYSDKNININSLLILREYDKSLLHNDSITGNSKTHKFQFGGDPIDMHISSDSQFKYSKLFPNSKKEYCKMYMGDEIETGDYSIEPTEKVDGMESKNIGVISLVGLNVSNKYKLSLKRYMDTKQPSPTPFIVFGYNNREDDKGLPEFKIKPRDSRDKLKLDVFQHEFDINAVDKLHPVKCIEFDEITYVSDDSKFILFNKDNVYKLYDIENDVYIKLDNYNSVVNVYKDSSYINIVYSDKTICFDRQFYTPVKESDIRLGINDVSIIFNILFDNTLKVVKENHSLNKYGSTGVTSDEQIINFGVNGIKIYDVLLVNDIVFVLTNKDIYKLIIPDDGDITFESVISINQDITNYKIHRNKIICVFRNTKVITIYDCNLAVPGISQLTLSYPDEYDVTSININNIGIFEENVITFFDDSGIVSIYDLSTSNGKYSIVDVNKFKIIDNFVITNFNSKNTITEGAEFNG